MSNEEKIKLIEETLDLKPNSLNEDTLLSTLPEYDSMAKLGLIVMSDDEFDKKLTGEQIQSFKTVKDILDFLG